jgi:hypothetical protein
MAQVTCLVPRINEQYASRATLPRDRQAVVAMKARLCGEGQRRLDGLVPRRISRFALQQRSRIDSTEAADGPRRLMWAILKDTLCCYQANAAGTSAREQRLFRDAERWIQSGDCSWVFSFENICAVLDIDGELLRNQLKRWRRAQIERPERAQIERPERRAYGT